MIIGGGHDRSLIDKDLGDMMLEAAGLVPRYANAPSKWIFDSICTLKVFKNDTFEDAADS